MHFQLDQHFRGTADAVAAAFVEAAVLARFGDLPQLGAAEVLERLEEGDGSIGESIVRLRVRYRFAGRLPSAATRVVDPNRLTWVEESVLDRRTLRTEFAVLPDHYPEKLRCAGTVSVHQADDGTSRRTTAASLTVRVPFVGGRVERAIVAGLREHAAAQVPIVQEWLDGRR